MRLIIILLIATILLAKCTSDVYAPKREFRGVWIATVNNIDWPSSANLSPEKQRDELRYLLDYHHLNGFNAIIMQIRPAADALYPSNYEPWSSFLTGELGKPPVPYYDPLHFAINECHNRGMEFHAWFNPYRAAVKIDSTLKVTEDTTHITNQHPEWFLKYGNRLYFDPGIPEVRAYVTEVMLDVVRRYAIDAVHFDDYFYPYKIAGEVFPDSITFQKYQRGFADVEEWRRDNVNLFVKMLSDSIKANKPQVKFGISPFGVWRNKDKDPKGSDTKAGQTNYDDLYADVLKWLREGWIDYVVPQIYWHIGFDLADYAKLLDWWSQHSYGKHIYVGHGAYRIDQNSQIDAWRNPSEIHDQLRLNKKYPQIKGSAYFSSRSLVNNSLGFVDSLRNRFYAYPAIIPEMDWIDNSQPPAPYSLTHKIDNDGILLQWNFSDLSSVNYFLVYRFNKNEQAKLNNAVKIVAKVRAPIDFYKDSEVEKNASYQYLVTALDPLQNESDPSEIIEIKYKR